STRCGRYPRDRPGPGRVSALQWRRAPGRHAARHRDDPTPYATRESAAGPRVRAATPGATYADQQCSCPLIGTRTRPLFAHVDDVQAGILEQAFPAPLDPDSRLLGTAQRNVRTESEMLVDPDRAATDLLGYCLRAL